MGARSLKENAGDSCGVLLRNAVSPDQSGSMVEENKKLYDSVKK